MIVNGFCKEVFRELPMEFAVEAQKLLGRQSRRERRDTREDDFNMTINERKTRNLT